MEPNDHDPDHPHEPAVVRADHGHSHGGCGHALTRGTITTRAALVSVGSNLFLAVLKMGTGAWIGSAAVLSEGLHSASDLIASISAFVSVRFSSQPADEAHPYGHGKYEDLSAVFEAGLIIVAAAGVIWKAIEDFVLGRPLEHLEYGIGVMAVSIVLNTVVSRYLFRTAEQQDSLALEADAWHLSADVFTSLGVVIGLVLVGVTGRRFFDPLAALGVGFYIVGEAYKIGSRGLANLVDRQLPESEVSTIESILSGFSRPSVQFHALRTRKAGPDRHVDVHLVVGPDLAPVEVHDLTHSVEVAIRERFPRSRVLVRLELEGHRGSCAPDGDSPD
jgi:cation diffusion facilitator family transporter